MTQQDKPLRSDEELLTSFFDAHTIEIPDEGFSARVMRRLPRRAKRLNQIWATICFGAAMALFVLYDGTEQVHDLMTTVWGNIIGVLTILPYQLGTIMVLMLAVTWVVSFKCYKAIIALGS